MFDWRRNLLCVGAPPGRAFNSSILHVPHRHPIGVHGVANYCHSERSTVGPVWILCLHCFGCFPDFLLAFLAFVVAVVE